MILLSSVYVHSQKGLEMEFQLNDSTFIKTIPLTILKGTTRINCRASGKISLGEIYFRILDPEGKEEGGLGLMADMTDDIKNNIADGIMTDSFNKPYPGKWTIVLKSEHASGIFNFTIQLE